jgi:WD40 repeat protein
VLVSADGDPRAFGKRDSTVRIWDLVNGKHVGAPLRAHTASLAVRALTLMRCGSCAVIVSGDSNGLLCLWKLDGHPVGHLDVGAPVLDLAVTPRNTLVVATGQGLIALRFAERQVG